MSDILMSPKDFMKSGNDWKKVGEYIYVKYFVSDDVTSSQHRTILRKLSDKEFELYEPGIVIDGYLRIVAFGDEIYVNTNTGADIRIPFQKI